MKCRVEEIAEAYQVLDNAKYQKLEDDDKVKLWKISRKLGPIALQYKEDSDDAQKKLLPSEDIFEKVQKALVYQKMIKEGKTEGLPLTKEEHREITQEWNRYDDLVKKALQELKDKEVELDMELLSEEAFGKLMASNDWTMKQVKAMEFLVKG